MCHRADPGQRGLTLIEVIAATVLLALVAVTVTPALRRSGPSDDAITVAETWLRARLAQGATATVPAPAGLQWRQSPLPSRAGAAHRLPGTAAGWTLIEVIDARGRVLAWRVLPHDGESP